MANLKNTTINDTGFVKLPTGTTGQRPNSPENGYIRYNTTTNSVEYFDQGLWAGITQQVSASVTGNVYSYNIHANGIPYRVHVFKGNGSITFQSGGEIEFLAVAGGGGAGGGGGGGGGGGMVESTTRVADQTYNITVGSGGLGQGGGSSGQPGNKGNDSVIEGIATAVGGGGGAGIGGNHDASGGSGGGQNKNQTTQGGEPVLGQGNFGGAGGIYQNNGWTIGGGGGGAGGPGRQGTQTSPARAGDGGPGRPSEITGYTVYYSPGGAGANQAGHQNGGYGGRGGGGFGPQSYRGDGFDGLDFIGAGGASSNEGGSNYGDAGNGGQGIVVIRYKDFSSFYGKPSYTTEGLVYHIDASDIRSLRYGLPDQNTVGDLSPKINNGTFSNINDFTLSGENGGYFGFDGSSTYIDVGAPSSLVNLGGSDVTCVAVVRLNSLSKPANTLISPRGEGSNELYFGINPNRLILDRYPPGGGSALSTLEISSTNEWYFVAIAGKAGESCRFHINDNYEFINHPEIYSGDPATSVLVGAQEVNGIQRHFDGDIAMLMLYDRLLGILEVEQILNSIRGRFGI